MTYTLPLAAESAGGDQESFSIEIHPLSLIVGPCADSSELSYSYCMGPLVGQWSKCQMSKVSKCLHIKMNFGGKMSGVKISGLHNAWALKCLGVKMSGCQMLVSNVMVSICRCQIVGEPLSTHVKRFSVSCIQPLISVSITWYWTRWR